MSDPLKDLSRLRQEGWFVAAHYDYKAGNERRTYWLFSRDGACVEGSGESDAEALNEVLEVVAGRRRVK